ncbi:MAG: efflux RND transporter periplasmic adaptor subunit [Bryobacterales bacterium]|nr:efflux RND transporter periplasmic adaptor subunit [Bryobacterales bacterium]
MKQTIFVLILAGSLVGCGSKPAATNAGEGAAVPASQAVAVDASTRSDVGITVQAASDMAVNAPVSATGQMQLNEDRTWRVGALIEGRIVAVPVRLGEQVKAGQAVAQMHSHEVHDARATHRQAVADLERLKVLAEQARRVRDRTRRLFELTAASREQLEAAETALRSAEFSVTNADAEVQKAETHITEFLEVPIKDTHHNEKGLDDQDTVPIKAPAAGTVMERLANTGTVVSVATPVVVISDLSSLWLIAAVNEADLSQIRQGQAVAISVRAYPERTFRGTVFQLGERLDQQTRTLQVRILVANAGGLLKPDMFATVDFAPQGNRKAIHVPESAVQEWNGKPVVFVQKPDKTFVLQPVTLGERTSRQIEIKSGLVAGDPVVVNGALLLKSQLLKAEGN